MQCSAATRWAIYKSKSSTRSVPRRFAGLSVVVICFFPPEFCAVIQSLGGAEYASG